MINEQTADFGYNWAAAITSVMYNQELSAITENSIRSLAKSIIDFLFKTEDYEEKTTITNDKGETEEVTISKKRIIIDILRIGPDKLMEKLEFSAFQKEWAHYIYGNMTETQVSDKPSVEVPDDGGILDFSDGNTEVFYYKQNDPRWKNLPYGVGNTIGEAGCGPTALAIAVASLTDKKVTPPEMADWAVKC